MLNKILLLSLLFLFQGCTSLFFYPDKHVYRTPEFYDLKYDDIYFNSFDDTRLHAWRIYPKQAEAVSEGDVSLKQAKAVSEGDVSLKQAEAVSKGDVSSVKQAKAVSEGDVSLKQAEAVSEGDVSLKQAKAVSEGDVSPVKAESKGLIFVAHGNAQNLSSHFTSWVWLIENGYELFIFDYRGYGNSEGETDLEGSIKDTAAALSHLESIYKKPYFVCGQSLGGTLLLNALHEHDNSHIKAVIIDSTFAGFAQIANEKMDQSWITWPFQWMPYLSLRSDFDAKDKVFDIGIPLLFLHGSLDSIITPNHSWQLFELSTPPRELWIVKNENHIRSLNNPNVQKDFLNFLQNGNFYSENYSSMKVYE